MLERFMPKEGQFLKFFQESAKLVVQGAHEFQQMIQHLDKAELYAQKLKEIENHADKITHQTIEMLHHTFITPMDRDDIHGLISKLDDVVDYIEAAAQSVFLFEVKAKTQEMEQLADICVRIGSFVERAVMQLENLKNPKEIVANCIEIHKLENEADFVLSRAIARLFREEPDTRQLIKLKEIYELLEAMTDRCEDVANILESIVLEYA